MITRCVDACLDCAQACAHCADACLTEPAPKMLIRCARLAMDCADICVATAQLAARRVGPHAELLTNLIALCAEACRLCAVECERHAGQHRHCADCAEACRVCERACRDALTAASAA